jgi:hypothetical protein
VNIHLQYSLTPEDLIEFERTSARISKKLAGEGSQIGLTRSLVGWLVILVTAITLFLLFHKPAPRPAAPAPNRSFDWFSFMPYGVVFLLIWGSFFRVRYSRTAMRKAFKNDPRLSERQEVTLCEEHATFCTETATNILSWMHFLHFAETKTLFVLMVSRTSAQLIPKRAFGSPEEMEELRGYALANVGNKPVGLPVQNIGPAQPPANVPCDARKVER